MHLYLVGFVFYFIIVGLIGLAAYLNKSKSKLGSDYTGAILGNRSINYFLTALSAHASDMSDWLFLALPAALYGGGLVNIWIAIGLVCGMWLTWTWIAPDLRRQTEKNNSYTLSTFFENHFEDNSGVLRLLSAAMSLLFFSVYIAAGLKGFGYIAESVFDMNYHFGVFIAILCVIFYISLGGYRSLAWIDCFQAIFLFLVIITVPVVALIELNGFDAIIEQAKLKSIPLTLLPSDTLGTVNVLLMAFSWMVGYFGVPHVLTKFMGIKNLDNVTKARNIGMTWQVSVLGAAALVGIIGIAYFPVDLANKELVFIEMSKSLFSPLVTGFILSAVAGAILSVVTAQVLVLVSVLTEDFYKRTLRPQATNRELIWVYRFGIIIIALFSFAVSSNKTISIQELVHYAWMGFGCSFGPLVILSLHSKYINRFGAGAAIITGGSIAALWEILFQVQIFKEYGLQIPAVIPGFILSFAFAYLISWLSKKRLSN